jgi:hypothetical protein
VRGKKAHSGWAAGRSATTPDPTSDTGCHEPADYAALILKMIDSTIIVV